MRRLYPLCIAATLLLIGSLAACSTFEASAPAPAPTAAAKAPAKKPGTKTVAAKPGKADKSDKTEKAEPPAPAVEARPEVVLEPVAEAAPPEPVVVAPRPSGPVDLVGKREEDVVALLGRPASENPSSPGKVLSFRGEGCAIQVHLFPDVTQGGFRALELISISGDLAPEHCAGRIRSTRS